MIISHLAWMDEDGVIPDLNLGSEVTIDALTFNPQSAAPSSDPYVMWGDEANKTVSLNLPGGEVVVQIGKERVQYVKNDEGAEIPNGTPVYKSGTDGDLMLVKIASKDHPVKAQVVGITTETLANGGEGHIVTAGEARGIDTTSFLSTDTLWLGNAGAVLNVRPEAGPDTFLQVVLGSPTTDPAVDGTIGVRIIIVQRIDSLSNVLLDSPETGDIISYVGANTRWELGQNVSKFTVPFENGLGATGTQFFGGDYDFVSGNSDFSGGITAGQANEASAKHFGIVTGAVTVDEVTITVTGNSITDLGVRTVGDTDTIVIPDATPANSYFETDKKWLGQITVTLTSGTGIQCNYGGVKYWDNSNVNFRLRSFEVEWAAGANDANPDIKLIHHKKTGWTYNVGSTPTFPYLESMADTYGTDKQLISGQKGFFKRTELDVDVAGGDSEGLLWAITNTANNAFKGGRATARVTQR